MAKEHGAGYAKYRVRTPFMFPLPRFFSSLISSPIQILFKTGRPESGKQIAAVLLIYGGILVLLSLPFVLLNWPPQPGWAEFPYDVWPFAAAPAPMPLTPPPRGATDVSRGNHSSWCGVEQAIL